MANLLPLRWVLSLLRAPLRKVNRLRRAAPRQGSAAPRFDVGGCRSVRYPLAGIQPESTRMRATRPVPPSYEGRRHAEDTTHRRTRRRVRHQRGHPERHARIPGSDRHRHRHRCRRHSRNRHWTGRSGSRRVGDRRDPGSANTVCEDRRHRRSRAVPVPDLPRATYNVWVRGYGLVDSPKTRHSRQDARSQGGASQLAGGSRAVLPGRATGCR
jgi:hypothetical protein